MIFQPGTIFQPSSCFATFRHIHGLRNQHSRNHAHNSCHRGLARQYYIRPQPGIRPHRITNCPARRSRNHAHNSCHRSLFRQYHIHPNPGTSPYRITDHPALGRPCGHTLIRVGFTRLYDVDYETITNIMITHQSQKIEYILEADTVRWMLFGDPSSPVAEEAWAGTPSLLSSLRFNERISDTIRNPAELGLDPPEYEVRNSFEGGDPPQFHIGVSTLEGTNRYLRTEGDEALYTVNSLWAGSVARLFTNPPQARSRSPAQLRHPAVAPTPAATATPEHSSLGDNILLYEFDADTITNIRVELSETLTVDYELDPSSGQWLISGYVNSLVD